MIWQLMFSLFLSEKTVRVFVHTVRMCVYITLTGFLCAYTVCVPEPSWCMCALVCSCTVLSATTRVVSHFELPLSDSYRLDVCVAAEASKQRLALCIPLEKVTLEYPH